MSQLTAYGVSEEGELDRCTLHDHARGAMVNWLHRRGYPIHNGMPGEDIRHLFIKVCSSLEVQNHRVELVLVELRVAFRVNAGRVDLTAPPPPAGPTPVAVNTP